MYIYGHGKKGFVAGFVFLLTFLDADVFSRMFLNVYDPYLLVSHVVASPLGIVNFGGLKLHPGPLVRLGVAVSSSVVVFAKVQIPSREIRVWPRGLPKLYQGLEGKFRSV